jgi:hypothetical protein
MEYLLLIGRSERKTIMRKFILTTLMVSVGFLATASLRAETAPTQKHQPNAKQIVSQLKEKCGSDINKLCSGIKPGEGRIAACLDSREDQLSASCKTTWMTTKADVSKRIDRADVAFRKECGADAQKFCSEVPSGKGRILSCLSKHQSDLSTSCKNFQAQLDQKLDEFIS